MIDDLYDHLSMTEIPIPAITDRRFDRADKEHNNILLWTLKYNKKLTHQIFLISDF